MVINDNGFSLRDKKSYVNGVLFFFVKKTFDHLLEMQEIESWPPKCVTIR